jgi:outer membrane protein insertion porin family/translocation and assembly module TamA
VPQGKHFVGSLDVRGQRRLGANDLEEHIATAATPKFLGLFRGLVYDYALFDRFVLARDLERIERRYRAMGFYDAHVRAGRVFARPPNRVDVDIVVEEGDPVLVRGVRVQGLEELTPRGRARAERKLREVIERGQRFEEKMFTDAQDQLHRAVLDEGYAFSKVERDAAVDLPHHVADVMFRVTPGPVATFGDVHLEGLGELPPEPVLRALDIRTGARFSQRELDDAKQAALDLEVFADVSIEPQVTDPPPTPPVVPIKVRVEPTRLRSVRLGGGLELDVIRADLHLKTQWEDHNFLGGLRRFQVQFKPGMVLYPTRLPEMQPPSHVLPEERFNVELRRSGVFEARTAGFIRPELNTYPVLVRPIVIPGETVLGYLEGRATAGLQRTFFRKIDVTLSETVQVNRAFAYLGDLAQNIGTLVISYPELLAILDLRNDRVKPHSGAYFSNSFQVAGLGGQPFDVRIQPEARGYIPIGRHVTLALRATVGFLFPFNYAQGYNGTAQSLDPRDAQILFFRGFFSGGPNSNRGYPLRGVGPHGFATFYDPTLEAQMLAQQCTSGNGINPQCAVPLGGMSLWEASAELRFPIHGPLSGAGFCDASDVMAAEFSLRFTRPHLSCGGGVRFDTPVGPIRADVAYRIPGLQVLEPVNPVEEGAPPDLVTGVPIAIQLGIGEAF